MLHSVQELACTDCGRQFKRIQELKRHQKEKHGPWRKCPFCKFEWARPDKIKLHITTHHRDEFTAKAMENFRALYGKRMIAFLDDFDRHAPCAPRADADADSDVEIAPGGPSALHPSPPPSPSPSRDSSPP